MKFNPVGAQEKAGGRSRMTMCGHLGALYVRRWKAVGSREEQAETPVHSL